MDDFRRGANEWGRKARKAEKRKCRQKLKRAAPTPDEARNEYLVQMAEAAEDLPCANPTECEVCSREI